MTIITNVVNDDGGTAKPEDFGYKIRSTRDTANPAEFTGPRAEVELEISGKNWEGELYCKRHLCKDNNN